MTLSIFTAGVTETLHLSLDNASFSIEEVEFADGVVWRNFGAERPIQMLGTSGNDSLSGTVHSDDLSGGAGNDTISGGDASDTLTGGLGNDTLKGQGGGDTYIWQVGHGSDTIEDGASSLTDVDVLVLQGVLPSDVTLTRASGSAHLLIAIGQPGTQEVITVKNQFASATSSGGIELIEFSDGTRWTLADLQAHTTTSGTTGNDSLSGSALSDNLLGGDGNDTISAGDGDDLLIGGKGNDTLSGGKGWDTYSWSLGDGNDIISDGGTSRIEVDTLLLTDVVPSNVTLLRTSGSEDLRIKIGTAEITVVQQFRVSSSGLGGLCLRTVRFGPQKTFSRVRKYWVMQVPTLFPDLPAPITSTETRGMIQSPRVMATTSLLVDWGVIPSRAETEMTAMNGRRARAMTQSTMADHPGQRLILSLLVPSATVARC
nr:calcium-binding protein [Frigidibacter mobilis]